MSRSVLLVGNYISAHTNVRSVGEELGIRLRSAGWNVVATSSYRSALVRVADMLTTVLRARNAYELACVEVYSGRAFRWAEAVCAALRAVGRPYLLALHGGNLPPFARSNPVRVRRLLAGARLVTAPSAYLVEQMREYAPRLELIPNAIDVQAYPFQLRRRVRPRLIWLRAFHEIYNPSLAVAVVERLRRSQTGVSLTMVGPDKGDGALERTRAAIASAGLDEQVRIVGGIPKRDVPARLAEGDIFLNTTDIDNTPVSVLEALACGLCVVSTRVGGIPYVLEDGEDALLVPARDPDAMAAACSRLFDEPGLAERLSRNGRRNAESLDWRVVLPRWEDALERAARRAS
ncbi:MAG TPA: glycosyltransferase family 4 protein [Gemmatimonadaceae bacterium]|nr:glycosyltransferase family 4 protein [Gemmatimonadaceae bacterium]